MALGVDWSGTVSDDRRPVHFAINEIMRRHGKPEIAFDDWTKAPASSATELFRLLGIRDDPSVLQKLYEDVFLDVVKSGLAPEPYPKSVEAIKSLHGIGVKVFVVSTHPISRLLHEAETYGIRDCISIAYGDSKYKAADIRDACRRFGVDPRNAFYVGDTTHDARASRKAGTITVVKLGGYHSKEKFQNVEYDMMIEHLTELEPYFIF